MERFIYDFPRTDLNTKNLKLKRDAYKLKSLLQTCVKQKEEKIKESFADNLNVFFIAKKENFLESIPNVITYV